MYTITSVTLTRSQCARCCKTIPFYFSLLFSYLSEGQYYPCCSYINLSWEFHESHLE